MFIKIRVVYILTELRQPGRKSMKTKILTGFLCPNLHGIGETAFGSPAPRVGNREDLADDVDINADIERGPL